MATSPLYFNDSDFNLLSPPSPFDEDFESMIIKEDSNLKYIDFSVLGDGFDLQPYLEIVEQPIDKFRFRYRTESTHGHLSGRSPKSVPTVKLHNYYGEKAIIRCMVFQKSGNQFPHPHIVIKKNINNDEMQDALTYFDIEISQENDYTVRYNKMAIICTEKNNFKNVLVNKFNVLKELDNNFKNYDVNQMIDALLQSKKLIDINILRLRFDALKLENDEYVQICEPVYSDNIYNSKSTKTCELKITRMSKCSCQSTGREEMFLFVEKIDKKDIEVWFVETDERNNEIWKALGEFHQTDVHHQYGIVVKIPPYKNIDITENVEVFIELRRPTDKATSERRHFIYTPSEVIGRKRLRLSNDSVHDFTSAARALNTNPDEDNQAQKFDIAFPDEDIDEFLQKYSLNNTTDSMLSYNNPCFQQMKMANRVCSEILSVILANANIIKVKKMLNVYFGKNEKHQSNNNALHAALFANNIDMINFIIKTFVKYDTWHLVNTPNRYNETPLQISIQYNGIEVVEKILRLKPNILVKDLNGNTPLHTAVLTHDSALVGLILTVPNVEKFIDVENIDGVTALHLAVNFELFEIVELLCFHKANVNIVRKTDGATPLHCAVIKRNLNLVNCLLNSTNINVTIPNYKGDTPLQLAESIVTDVRDENSIRIFENIKHFMEQQPEYVKYIEKCDITNSPASLHNTETEPNMYEINDAWEDITKLVGMEHLNKTNLFDDPESRYSILLNLVNTDYQNKIKNMPQNLKETKGANKILKE